ncbi:hypothetical protein SNK03_011366 [Fusarium graminearum]|uniref:Chromosome 3, complete genome n=2 Tax=Gibberella zeae TaxID=5518 RepID=I1RN44_GIBZE|nr:hypothetical protein FGSG_05407 [Fusarium graminearum PH-1]EYB30148.1 hypothetical protein FG05_05407 [Fusarium graminearum]ESU11362.1 hypothetical protein FGSG_05407 [Fusarium graminearum PH-1]KAI6757364.1 hypothetical protein HG531_003189 [Fusarium graminearum]PCD40283.1 hypothetical protein FGRA07_01554 [Fusarium graminearum]CAF3508402.1 unnamed protein product [Fusarium graminearum]|eukprot:XP_011323938.1 hypothetical protein FGSG_05407 [Fusarium graminearum PH-1]
MRPTSSILQVAVCLTSLAPLASAWPSWFPNADSVVVRRVAPEDLPLETPVLKPRQDTTTEEETTGTKKSPKQTNLNTAKVETGTETGTATEDSTKTAKETGNKKSGTKTGTSAPKRTTFSADVQPGGLSMTLPDTMYVPTPLIKIGDYATFGWNYTSLEGTPTAIDVLVSQSSAGETYTLTANMTFETNPTYVWDTSKQANDPDAPLPVGMYTLIIMDSDSEITDVPSPGYLAVQKTFQFGMYTPAAYTPYPQWNCDICDK